MQQQKRVNEVQIIGNINVSIFEKEFGKLQSSEVVLTIEREAHIKAHHNDDYHLFEIYSKEIVSTPDIVLCDEKNVGTVFMIKRLPNTNLNAVIRLALESDIEGRKNSIMTFYRIRESNLDKLISKNKTIYKKE